MLYDGYDVPELWRLITVVQGATFWEGKEPRCLSVGSAPSGTPVVYRNTKIPGIGVRKQ